jgi:hypothetical protein
VVNFYVKRIRKGLMTLEDVPERWRDAVREALEG